MSAVVERNDKGQFLTGVSGNPDGRPKGKKNQITALKQDLEIAIREQVPARRIKNIVLRMCDLAEQGNVGAAKLILDKTLSNAKEAEEVNDGQSGVVFVVKNVTLQAVAEAAEQDEQDVIDITPQEEK